MSWIESHQSLSRHRKTLRVVTLLKVDRHKLLGHLHELWWWGLDNATSDGLLTGMSDEEVAHGAEWPARDAQRFIDALVSAGFLERTDAGLALHDWYEFAGKLNDRREANRDRQRKHRAQNAHVTRDKPVTSLDTSRHRHGATVPTVPNQPPVVPQGDDCYRRVCDLWLSETGTTLPAAQAERFEAYAERTSEAWVADAIRETGKQGKNRPAYTFTILDRWIQDGHPGARAEEPSTDILADSQLAAIAELGRREREAKPHLYRNTPPAEAKP